MTRMDVPALKGWNANDSDHWGTFGLKGLGLLSIDRHESKLGFGLF